MRETKPYFTRICAAALFVGVLLLFVVSACGCSGSRTATKPKRAIQNTSQQSQGQTVRPQPSEAPTATPAGPHEAILSPEQMAGQRIIYGYSGLTPPAELLSLIRHGEAAGVIFFSDNISSRSQLRQVTKELAQANASPDNPVRAPLLLMTDQEGGRIRRLPGAPLFSEKQIGESAEPALAAKQAGTEAGKNLGNLGLNVNLAPVVDVYRSAGNFDDRNGRSYSSDPAVAATLGAAFIRAQQRVGVAATAKHFPGLGTASAAQDTDEGSVTLDTSLGSLRNVDELPFRAAVAARVKLIMVSWAVYPALDPRLPAGLSSVIVKDSLRGSLGFDGVVISDGMQADALTPYGTIGNRARMAAKAGIDLLICAKSNSSVAVGLEARDELATGLRNGSLSRAEFSTSVQRVIALRRSLGN